MNLLNKEQLIEKPNKTEDCFWNNFTDNDWNNYDNLYIFSEEISKLSTHNIFSKGYIHRNCDELCIRYRLTDFISYDIIPTDNKLYKIQIFYHHNEALQKYNLVNKSCRGGSKDALQIYNEYINLLSQFEDV